MLYIFGKLSSSECYANLACSAATYRFRDIRGQSLGFFGPYGVPQRGDFVSGTDIYHRAKFHADRCRRRRDTCNRTNRKLERITTDSISDKTHTSVAFVDNYYFWSKLSVITHRYFFTSLFYVYRISSQSVDMWNGIR